MRLLMFLYIRKHEFCSENFKDEGGSLKLEYPKDITDFIPNLKYISISRDTDYKVGYWEKANHIHNWLIKNCATRDRFDKPIDDCRPIEIPIEKLEELLSACKKVLENKSLASSLLPTKNGFNFGSTKYGEWYFDDIENTIKIIEPIVEFMKNKEENEDYTWNVIYHANW